MTKSRIAAAAALMAVTGAAVGGNVSATVGLVSDYDFRGISQTLNDPAFQMGLTYTSDTGLYYGLWGSNVDFQGADATFGTDIDRPSTELDVFLGFSGEKVVGYDLGIIYYAYPNAGDINAPEVYAGITKGPFSAKLWYSWDWGNTGESEVYTEVNFNLPMSEGFNFLAHAGYTNANKNVSVGNYLDWSLGIGYDVNNLSLSLKYVDGNDYDTGIGGYKNLGRFVFGVSTALPWGKE